MKKAILIIMPLILAACSSIETRRNTSDKVEKVEKVVERYNAYCNVQGLPIVEINAKLVDSKDGVHKLETDLGRGFIVPMNSCLLEKVIPGVNDGTAQEPEEDKSLMLPEVVPYPEDIPEEKKEEEKTEPSDEQSRNSFMFEGRGSIYAFGER